MELPDDKTIVLAGLRGNAWRSTDAHENWVRIASPVPVSITASAIGADDAVLFANQAGMVLGLEGETLKPLNAGALPPLNFVLPLGKGRVLAPSIQGIVRVDWRGADEARKGPSQ